MSEDLFQKMDRLLTNFENDRYCLERRIGLTVLESKNLITLSNVDLGSVQSSGMVSDVESRGRFPVRAGEDRQRVEGLESSFLSDSEFGHGNSFTGTGKYSSWREEGAPADSRGSSRRRWRRHRLRRREQKRFAEEVRDHRKELVSRPNIFCSGEETFSGTKTWDSRGVDGNSSSLSSRLSSGYDGSRDSDARWRPIRFADFHYSEGDIDVPHRWSDFGTDGIKVLISHLKRLLEDRPGQKLNISLNRSWSTVNPECATSVFLGKNALFSPQVIFHPSYQDFSLTEILCYSFTPPFGGIP